MSSVSSTIASMKTNTALVESRTEKKGNNDIKDSNMFLKLMLKQMEQQDPTEPTDNSQWLAQMAQYSTLESMNNLNTSFSAVSKQLEAMNDSILSGNVINQTLSLVGKDVTLSVPKTNEEGYIETDEKGNPLMEEVKGKVEEAAFENGEGLVKVGDSTYPISCVVSIR